MAITLDSKQQWLQGVRHLESPNCDERPDIVDISLIVVHGISLPPQQYGGNYVDQLFTNKLNPDEHPYFSEIMHLNVSSHLFIDRQGDITQYVPFHKRAWHAGNSSFQGREQCNDFSIGIELEGCDHEPYESVQYSKLAEIVRVLQLTWSKIEKTSIVGHCHVAPGRKTDPGPAFDWDTFYDLLC